MAQPHSAHRLWSAWFNGPLYVPKEGRHVLTFLQSGKPHQFIAELERLSMLGSPWASAVLGYIALMPGPDGKRDTGRALHLCQAPAQAGDPYAQFVYGWALLHTGETAHAQAYRAMRKAMLAGFPPAIMDFAKFLWNTTGNRQRHR